jgi:hypothetical protein
VFDDRGRSVRVQPLGLRTRLTLARDDQPVAEGEVDTGVLIARVAMSDTAYDVLAAALAEENGPSTHSR